jgi:hypothetical protein
MKTVLFIILFINFFAPMGEAQTAKTTDPETDEPALIGKIVQVFGERISKINFASHFASFDPKDPLAGRRYAVFSAEGALIYDRDWRGRDKDFKHSDVWVEARDAGLNIIPYSIAVMPSGQKMISFAGLAVKDLLRRTDAERTQDSDSFPINERNAFVPIQNGSIMTFKWDEYMNYSNIKSFTITPVAIELGIPLTAFLEQNYEEFPKHIVAITAGSSLNWVHHLQMDRNGAYVNNRAADTQKGPRPFQQQFSAGARYIYDGKRGWTVDTAFKFQYRKLTARSVDMNQGQYQNFTWESWYWNPSVTVEKRTIRTRKVRHVGATLEANLPNYDVFRFKKYVIPENQKLDRNNDVLLQDGKRSMIPYNNQILKVGVWVKF